MLRPGKLASFESFHISRNSRPTPELFQRPSPPAHPFESLAQLANFLAVPGPGPGPLRFGRRLEMAPRFTHLRLGTRTASRRPSRATIHAARLSFPRGVNGTM